MADTTDADESEAWKTMTADEAKRAAGFVQVDGLVWEREQE